VNVSFSWHVGNLVVQPNVGDHENVVSCVHFTLIGTDGTFGSSIYGSVYLDAPDGDFTPYASLTEAEAVSWVEAALGPDTINDLKAIVTQRIAEIAAAPAPVAALPWGSA